MALLAILLAAAAAGTFQPGPTHPIPAALAADLAELTGQWQGPLPDLPQELIESVLVVGLMMWTQLFGLVNHEVFGRLDDMIAARGEYFDHQVRLLGVLVGLG
jgi:hypothetical protein